MTGRRALVLAAMTAALTVSSATPVALAQETPAVTLEASETKIVVGDEVELSGRVSPAAAGETVAIVDAGGEVDATVATDDAGAFSATLSPEATTTWHAEWNGAASMDVTVRVRAVITVRLATVRLFDDVVVRGTVRPAFAGARVELTLIRDGRSVLTRFIRTGSAGGYRTRLPVDAPGTYRVRASFADEDHLRGTDANGPRSTPLPALRSGSNGVYVKLLELRLRELGYRIAGVDERYDFRTADAVVAFHKVQRMSRTFSVDAATWRALADPIVPRPRAEGKAFRIEVDQTRQVLYTVEDGEVTNIIHVSTGAGGATRDGSFRVHRKIAGFSPNRLYYPSYFDGLRAIHGWTEVPTYPASHGCVRVPYWHAKWIFGLAEYGTRVVVYH